MTKLIYSLIPATFFALPLLHAPASAAESGMVDMGDYLCKDVMRMSGDERAVTMGVLHGYRLGKKGATTFVSDDLANMSNEFVEFCLDNPHEKALAGFEKLAK
jgi:hypothetical protein